MKGGEEMGLMLIGLFIGYEARKKDGKPDGYNVLIAAGVDAYRVKISEDLFEFAMVADFPLGQKISAQVKLNTFKDRVYYAAESLDVVE